MSGVRWLDDDEMRLWRSLIAVSSGLIARLDHRLRDECALSFDDYEVLVHLSEAEDQRLRMSELSDRVLHSRSRLSQRVDRMVGRGLVTRAKVEDDARGTWAVLTDHGRGVLDRTAPTHLRHVREHLFDHIDADRIDVLADALERLARTVQTGPLLPGQTSSTDSFASR